MKFNIKYYLNIKNLTIPDWISSQVFIFEEEKRAYIYNERTHTDFLLEDESAILWNAFVESSKETTPYEDCFVEFKSDNLEDDISDFVDTLIAEDLLINANYRVNSCGFLAYDRNEDKAEQELFQIEKQKWCLEHNILESLSIELTYNCNLKCIHCYNDKSIKNYEISFEDIKPVIDDAKKLGVMSISLSGGECTLAKDFLKIAKYIREQRISLSIITNGQVFYDNPEMLDEFIKLYPSRISFSLYAMNEQIHDKITSVAGSHKKTLSVINKLCKNNVPVEIKSFQTKYNVLDFENVRDFAEKVGASFNINDSLLYNKSGSNSCIQTSEEQSYLLYKEIYKDEKILPKKFDEEFFNQQICLAGYSTLTISPQLQIKLCAALNIVLADLKKDSLYNLWMNSEKYPNFKLWRNLRRKDLKECYKYDYCHYCTYCPGKAYYENGYLKKSEVCCRDAKIKMRIAQEQTKH